jgi:hypothetical protein
MDWLSRLRDVLLARPEINVTRPASLAMLFCVWSWYKDRSRVRPGIAAVQHLSPNTITKVIAAAPKRDARVAQIPILSDSPRIPYKGNTAI